MGRIAAPYAIKGWIKVQPYTEWLDSLLDYPIWQIGHGNHWQAMSWLDAKVHGGVLLAQLEGVSDRDAAERLKGLEIAVFRDELPEVEDGEVYWNDLIGLTVINREAIELCKIAEILESGAHDILRIVDAGGEEKLVPFVDAFIVAVDLDARQVTVDWPADW